jgi:hypothetical protein
MMQPNRSVMDGPRALTQRPAIPAGQNSLDFGNDAQGDLVRRVSAYVEADWSVQVLSHVMSYIESARRDVVEDLFGAFPRPEKPKKGNGTAQERAKNRQIMNIAMSHDHRERAHAGCGAVDEFSRRGANKPVGIRKATRGRESGPRIGDSHRPPDLLGQSGEGPCIVTRPENDQARRGADGFEVDSRGFPFARSIRNQVVIK